MLVITRKNGESVRIGDGITVTVVEVGKDRVRIGINAPKDVKIVRTELAETEAFNIEASGSIPAAFMEELMKNKS